MCKLPSPQRGFHGPYHSDLLAADPGGGPRGSSRHIECMLFVPPNTGSEAPGLPCERKKPIHGKRAFCSRLGLGRGALSLGHVCKPPLTAAAWVWPEHKFSRWLLWEFGGPTLFLGLP